MNTENRSPVSSEMSETASKNTLALNPLVGIQGQDLVDSAGILFRAVTNEPRVATEQWLSFVGELGSIIAGGPSPFIAALLVGWMAGAPWGVACYVILLSLITAFAIWCGPETRFNDIRADTPEDLVADGPVAKHV